MKLVTHEVGSGSRTAALVHGASESSNAWHHFARILVDEHDLRLILVDQRGHGQSPRADSYDVADFAADLVETLPTGLDYLFGQSLGGRSGAIALPELMPGHFVGVDPAFFLPWYFSPMTHTMATIEKLTPRSVTRAQRLARTGAESLERQMANWDAWDRGMIHQLARSGRKTEYVPQPPIVPSTLVLAQKSVVVPPSRARRFAEFGWDVRTLPGAAHDMHIQDPAGLAGILRDVLSA